MSHNALPQPNARYVALNDAERKLYQIKKPQALVLLEPYEYMWFYRGKIFTKVRLPARYIFDGASIPFWAMPFVRLTTDGLIRAGAALHDAFYAAGGVLPVGWLYRETIWHGVRSLETWADKRFERGEIDDLFTQVNREAGLPRWKVRMAHIGVRMAGKSAWGRRREAPLLYQGEVH